MGNLNENLLHIFVHVTLLQTLATLGPRQNVLSSFKSFSRKSPSTRPGIGDGHATVNVASLHVWEKICEMIKLMLDLVSRVARVADHEDLDSLFLTSHAAGGKRLQWLRTNTIVHFHQGLHGPETRRTHNHH